MIITDQQKQDYKNCTKCWVCDERFTNENKKVKHHDHNTGLFYSPLCSNCAS